MRQPHHTHLTDRELLSLVDGELPPLHHAQATTHVDVCAKCRTRRAQIERVMGVVTTAYRRNVAAADLARERQNLHRSLTEVRGPLDDSLRHVPVRMRVVTPAWGLLAMVVVGLLAMDAPLRLINGVKTFASAQTGALPNPTLTPGATLPLVTAELCARHGEPRQHRLPASMREDVLQRYRMEHLAPEEYELDFLVTPELGGAPEPANLWPERYRQPIWNAHVKDQLEELLPRLVCSGRLRLDVAQRDIATDWIAAYQKYFDTPLPLNASAPRLPEQDEIVFEETGQTLLALAVLRPPTRLIRH